MIKFLIITRHKEGFSRERFYYEFAFIHVSLLLHTASSMRRFRRYVQHFVDPDIPDDCRILPASPMAWESIAEHWIERFEPRVSGAEYVEQMQPHSFSDSAMEITYLNGQAVWQRTDFRSGGIKLIHRLSRRSDQTDEQFRDYWRNVHVPLLLSTLQGRGLRRLAINTPHVFDPMEVRATLKGTLFERANFEAAQGFEELWFDSLADALELGRNVNLRDTLSASYQSFVNPAASYSMIANERVVFDYASPHELSPPAAVLDAATLDSIVFKTGRPYREPRLDSQGRDRVPRAV